MLPIVHHPAYQAELAADHRFPMGKFRRLAEVLVEDGIVRQGGFPGGFIEPPLASVAELERAHDPAYVGQVLEGRVPPATVREIGFPMSPSVIRRARAATGGTLLAARLALDHGLALNTAGGSHHARREQGAGFCVFNDVAVAARVLQAEHRVRRVLVVDCDVHQGDGTAGMFADDPSVFTLSLHAERNYPEKKIASDLDVALADGIGDDAYLDALHAVLEPTIDGFAPDIVFYNAGVDPHADDRLGRLAMTDEGLARRDRAVMDAVRCRGVPLVGVIGGGYDHDIDRLARRHAILHRTALEFA